jgi:two-component system, sensor histidine kinase
MSAGATTEARLAAMAHDLRQPIRSLLLLARVIADAGDEAARRRAAGYMEQSLLALQRMLEAGGTLSSLEADVTRPVLQNCQWIDVVAHVENELADAVSGRQARLCLEGAATNIESDPVLLAMILKGLVGNALKVATGPEIVVAWRPAGEGPLIAIRYAGPPIPPAQRKACFLELPALSGGLPPEAAVPGMAFIERLGAVLGLRLVSMSVADGLQHVALVPVNSPQSKS